MQSITAKTIIHLKVVTNDTKCSTTNIAYTDQVQASAAQGQLPVPHRSSADQPTGGH